ncbi:MAG: sigma-54 dependent transcriptional regulator [Polyangia bacterium]|nr:sigma-54 dependent transcriptional regulator [Polyangia bacterium]
MSGQHVLVVDDEPGVRETLGLTLRKNGYEVSLASTGEEAIDILRAVPVKVVLSDLRMPGMGGEALLDRIIAEWPEVTVILMSAYGSEEDAIDYIKKGAYDYLSKPIMRLSDVVLLLRKAEERERLKAENRALRKALGKEVGFANFVGRSAAMQRVFDTIRKIAEYKTTVLITGESGTGKELVARALHEQSGRQNAGFVAVNCGAIPEHLLESELFGHRRGAFTDASRDKKGLFEEADRGTIFLDEIGELPLGLQVKLLRALQEEQIRRVGDNHDRQLDVRVVAATVRDLGADVQTGRFREDLYYRLNVFGVHLPPLRERLDDIPALVEHFVERVNHRLGRSIQRVEPEALKLLVAYSWPGNVRELENTVEHAAVLCDGDEISVRDLPARFQGTAPEAPTVKEDGDLSIKKATRRIERDLIARALGRTGGNRTNAAKLLEISHRALLYKIKEYDLGGG